VPNATQNVVRKAFLTETPKRDSVMKKNAIAAAAAIALVNTAPKTWI